MSEQSTPTQTETNLQAQIDLFKKQLEVLEAQKALDATKQAQDIALSKALLDAIKNNTEAGYALTMARSQQPFAELQGIKTGISGLTLPTGKEGTINVAAGAPGTELLRSKHALLDILSLVAAELTEISIPGAVALTPAQLDATILAEFTRDQLASHRKQLGEAIAALEPKPSAPESVRPFESSAAPEIAAGIYGVGFALSTIQSLIKLFRTDRKIEIFTEDAEAMRLLLYLFEATTTTVGTACSAPLGQIIPQANELWHALQDLDKKVLAAQQILVRIAQPTKDAVKVVQDGVSTSNGASASAASVNDLQAKIADAILLYDALHPSKKAEAFWVQAHGQALAESIKDKRRLVLEISAQTVQVTESSPFQGDRLQAVADVLVTYRLLNSQNALQKSGVILQSAKIENLDTQPFKLPNSQAPRQHYQVGTGSCWPYLAAPQGI